MDRQWTCPTCGAHYTLAPAGAPRSTPGQPARGSNPDMITEAQRAKIFAVIGKDKYIEETARSHVKEKYDVDSTRELTKKQASELIQYLEKRTSTFQEG